MGWYTLEQLTKLSKQRRGAMDSEDDETEEEESVSESGSNESTDDVDSSELESNDDDDDKDPMSEDEDEFDEDEIEQEIAPGQYQRVKLKEANRDKAVSERMLEESTGFQTNLKRHQARMTRLCERIIIDAEGAQDDDEGLIYVSRTYDDPKARGVWVEDDLHGTHKKMAGGKYVELNAKEMAEQEKKRVAIVAERAIQDVANQLTTLPKKWG